MSASYPPMEALCELNYAAFFGMHQRPFASNRQLLTDALTPAQRFCLAALGNPGRRRQAVILLLGLAGTGKSVVLQHLKSAAPSYQRIVHYYAPPADYSSCLATLFQELNLPPPAADPETVEATLIPELVNLSRQNKSITLAFDEAHSLNEATLGSLLKLSGRLERALPDQSQVRGKKRAIMPLRLVLAATPGFSERFVSNISTGSGDIRFLRLGPLNWQQTRQYVRQQLRESGVGRRELFTLSAIDRIYMLSRGTPRLINALCDRSLFTAFLVKSAKITPELVDETTSALMIELPERDFPDQGLPGI